MRRRLLPAALIVAIAALLGGTSHAQTRYDYGGGGGRYASGDEGFLLQFEAGIANPRNTDNIVAAQGPNVIIPEWDDEFAGRLGLGYRFAAGNTLLFTFWGFDTDQSAAATGSFEFPIGPTSGASFDVKTEVEAGTAEASWIVPHEVTDEFGMEWSLGLRYASYEETTGGVYDGTVDGPLDVAKSIESDMIGARAAARAIYRRGSLSGSASVGLSFLSGEIKVSESLAPQPAGTVPLELRDDSRSGTILELDVRGTWHHANERLSVWLGWEQQDWDDIAADLARNLPGNEVIARSRDSVTFSWMKAGVSYRF
jgi:hypothetical protein